MRLWGCIPLDLESYSLTMLVVIIGRFNVLGGEIYKHIFSTNAWGNNRIILFPRQQAVMVDTTSWIHLVCHDS